MKQTLAQKISSIPWQSMKNNEIAAAIGASPATTRSIVRRMCGYVEPRETARRERMAARDRERIESARVTPDRIPLTKGLYARIDPSDFELLIARKWNAHEEGSGKIYAIAAGGVKMHRLIIGARRGEIVDHVNGDGLDNRRCNLRICDRQKNMWNVKKIGERSRFKGVWPNGPGWCAMITLDGQRTYLGQFATEEEAAIAYDKAAQEHRGEFAWLNSERIAV